MNQTNIVLITVCAVLVSLFLYDRLKRWSAERKATVARMEKLQADMMRSNEDLAKAVLSLSANMQEISNMPKYLDGLVKVCESMVKTVMTLRDSVAKFTVLVTGDSRSAKDVLQVATEEDQYRTSEIMARVAAGIPLDQAKQEFEDSEEKKLAGAGYAPSL